MNEFTKKLTALRQGAGSAVKKTGKFVADEAKGTLANMKRGLDGTAAKEQAESVKARDEGMIRENFGNEENYRNAIGTDQKSKDLFTPTYQKAGKAVGNFFDRLVKMRGKK